MADIDYPRFHVRGPTRRGYILVMDRHENSVYDIYEDTSSGWLHAHRLADGLNEAHRDGALDQAVAR